MQSLTYHEDINTKPFKNSEDLFHLSSIFSVKLADNKELVLFDEQCDQYFQAVLDKTNLQSLINVLQTIADQMKPLPKLTKAHKVGDYVSWTTSSGDSFVGRIKEWDYDVAVVTMADRSTKTVEC